MCLTKIYISFIALYGFLENKFWLVLQSNLFLWCLSYLQYDQIFPFIGSRRFWKLVCSWESIDKEICTWRSFFWITSSMLCLLLQDWKVKFLTGVLWSKKINASWENFFFKEMKSLSYGVLNAKFPVYCVIKLRPVIIRHQIIACFHSISSRWILSLFWQEDVTCLFCRQSSSVLRFWAS